MRKFILSFLLGIFLLGCGPGDDEAEERRERTVKLARQLERDNPHFSNSHCQELREDVEYRCVGDFTTGGATTRTTIRVTIGEDGRYIAAPE